MVSIRNSVAGVIPGPRRGTAGAPVLRPTAPRLSDDRAIRTASR